MCDGSREFSNKRSVTDEFATPAPSFGAQNDRPISSCRGSLQQTKSGSTTTIPRPRSSLRYGREAVLHPPMKARVTTKCRNTMVSMFADIRGMILLHAVPRGATVNAGYYSKIIKNKGFVYFCLLFVSSHAAAATQLEIWVLCFGPVQHPVLPRPCPI